MSSQSVVIVAAKRTPMGGFMGALSPVSATELGAEAIKSVVSGDTADIVDVQDYEHTTLV